MEVISAREQLRDNSVSAYPHMKKESTKETYQALKKIAYPRDLDTKEALSMDDARLAMQRILNG